VHGQRLVGKLGALISTGNEPDSFVLNKMRTMQNDDKHQRSAGTAVWHGRNIARVGIVPEPFDTWRQAATVRINFASEHSEA